MTKPLNRVVFCTSIRIERYKRLFWGILLSPVMTAMPGDRRVDVNSDLLPPRVGQFFHVYGPLHRARVLCVPLAEAQPYQEPHVLVQYRSTCQLRPVVHDWIAVLDDGLFQW